jgi:hypothetical protein
MMGEVFFREALAFFCPYFHFSLCRKNWSISSVREQILFTFHDSHYHLPTLPCFCLRTATTETLAVASPGNLNLSRNQRNTCFGRHISQALIITAQSCVLDHTRWLHQHFVYHPIWCVDITSQPIKLASPKISTQQLSGAGYRLVFFKHSRSSTIH